MSEFATAEPQVSVSWKIKLAYGLPDFGSSAAISFLATVHGMRYFQQMGATLAFLSFFMALARSADILTDPVMAWISDNTSKHWSGIAGRRRPYLVTGCFPWAIFLILWFSTPEGNGASYWFGMFYTVFFLFMTAVEVPYKALGPELSEDPKERDSIFMWSKCFWFFGMLFAAAGQPMLKVFYRGGIDIKLPCGDFYAVGSSQYRIPLGSTSCEASGHMLCFTTSGTSGAGGTSWFETQLDELEGACLRPAGLYESSSSQITIGFYEYGMPSLEAIQASFILTAAVFGFWYCVTMSALTIVIKERPKRIENLVAPPLVASMMRCFQNVAIRPLLCGWAFDGLAVAALAATFPFFVEYVVKPDGHVARGHGSQMTVDTCLGISMVALLLTAMASIPFWFFIASRFGKFRTWVAHNIFSAFSNLLFLIVNEGDPRYCICVMAVNGLPLGAQFLNDAILADVIDYDEFLNGVRTEGAFTVFASLIPKFVAIPASAIPLAVIYAMGFVEPVNAVAQAQPDGVLYFIRITFVFFPFVCMTIGMVAKLYFPIRKTETIAEIAAGIVLHAEGKPALDPVRGTSCELLLLTPEEEEIIWVFENYSQDHLAAILEGPEGVKRLRADMTKLAYRGTAALCCSVILTIATFVCLFNPQLAVIPVLSVISTGMFLCFSALNWCRLLAVGTLEEQLISDGTPEGNLKADNVRRLVQILIEHKNKGQRAGTDTSGVKGSWMPCFSAQSGDVQGNTDLTECTPTDARASPPPTTSSSGGKNRNEVLHTAHQNIDKERLAQILPPLWDRYTAASSDENTLTANSEQFEQLMLSLFYKLELAAPNSHNSTPQEVGNLKARLPNDLEWSQAEFKSWFEEKPWEN